MNLWKVIERTRENFFAVEISEKVFFHPIDSTMEQAGGLEKLSPMKSLTTHSYYGYKKRSLIGDIQVKGTP